MRLSDKRQVTSGVRCNKPGLRGTLINTQNNYKHPLMQRTIDGGYSGAVTITAGRIDDGTTMVSVVSELLGSLVLTAAEAA